MDATLDVIKEQNPHLVVNATGSVPLLPPIEGLHENLKNEEACVYSILDMIDQIDSYPEDMTGKKVVVIGGGAVGLDVVEFFAPRGADTAIVEMLPMIGNGLDASSTERMYGEAPGQTDDEHRADESKSSFLPGKIRWQRGGAAL